MNPIQINLTDEQVNNLEILFRNITVDTSADRCQGMTFSKAYEMAIFDICCILNISFEDGKLCVYSE